MVYPETPPVTDLSRSRLKQVAMWIRDDLDVLVAREGPDVLRPDDVLSLHETFVALRHAHVTVLDLRATGIHRAVQEIAGVATRWPVRLCDDCDKLISTWTARFGPLNELHPFLYGRGGRLEGIASATEYSKEALIHRWNESCPEKVHPKRSHRLGDLGFRPGAWWINPLFAYHAGIIGFESVEGGITFDKHGAYAIVLKGTGEVESTSEDHFTYRCPLSDKGKFRLTSATPQSRDPIRVLRSHDANSVWGPKAGIRYEGLHSVMGWSIRTAKTKDFASREWKEGDILFDIRIERKADKVSMEEVTRHPTATEVDDYSEYKRLRRVHREALRRGPTASSSKRNLQLVTNAAPPISPPQVVMLPSAAPKALLRNSESSSRRSLFKRPNFDEEPYMRAAAEEEVVSPMTVPEMDQFGLAISKDTLAVPPVLPISLIRGETGSSSSNARLGLSPVGSATSSVPTAVSNQSKIRDIAPWVDYEADLGPGDEPPVMREGIISQSPKGSPEPTSVPITAAQSSTKRETHDRPRRPGARGERRMGLTSYLSSGKKDIQKSPMRTRNPVAKLFDGMDEDAGDYFGDMVTTVRAASTSEAPKTPELPRRQRSSSDDTMGILSPTPLRSIPTDSPLSPFTMVRRDAICPANDFASLFPAVSRGKVNSMATLLLPTGEPDDPFVETTSVHLTTSLPVPLKNVISPPQVAMAVRSTASTPVTRRNEKGESYESLVAAQKATVVDQMSKVEELRMTGEIEGVEIKVAFREPFSGSPVSRKTLQREGSVGVAPDVVG